MGAVGSLDLIILDLRIKGGWKATSCRLEDVFTMLDF